MKFSQRIGLVPAEKAIQKDDIDNDLRNRLWNVLDSLILSKISDSHNYGHDVYPLKIFRIALYHHYFKKRMDDAPTYKDDIIRAIRNFYLTAKWYEVYEFIEFVMAEVKQAPYEINVEDVVPIFNSILESEASAYRIVDSVFSPITNETELKAVDEAIQQTKEFSALKGCNIHLTTALKLLSDKKSPDYRNSIKESISAIESIAKTVSKTEKDTLGPALEKLKSKIQIHPSLERGFKQIYGYTSDAGGIRHAILESSDVYFEDALYMLISCSAFVNYLIAKCRKADIPLT
jgi:hypothetical protein